MEGYFELGYVKRISGLKGVMLIQPETDRPEYYAEADAFFMEEGGQALPYFTEECSLDPKGLLRVRFEDIDNEEDARRMIGKKIYLPIDLLPPLEGNKFYFHEVIGWKVIDQSGASIGTIKDIYDRGPQELLDVMSEEGKQLLLPLVDQFLQKVDREHQQIILFIPEGLLEVFSDSKDEDKDEDVKN